MDHESSRTQSSSMYKWMQQDDELGWESVVNDVVYYCCVLCRMCVDEGKR